MLSQTIQAAINDQINNELGASYTYLAMSAFCELANFPGCARWLRLQSQEEYGHAMKLFDFLLARNGAVRLKAIAEPSLAFHSVAHVFEESLKQEIEVSGKIDALYELAFREKAFSALVELQWFITEQVEEEKSTRDIVGKFHLAKDDPASLLEIDRELGTRGSTAQTSRPGHDYGV
jgi:ferritin